MNNVVSLLDESKIKERFVQVDSNMNATKECSFALQHLKNNAFLSKAAQNDPQSLLSAVSNVASIGLSLNPALKHAYLIPRTVKVNNQFVAKVFLEPSYMGLKSLAERVGIIDWVQVKVVYDNDEFIDNGAGREPTHKYQAFKPRGEFAGVFCLAKLPGGDFLTEIMAVDQVNEIRDRSESWKAKMAGRARTGGPWESDYLEMARKTVLRRAAKLWPSGKSEQFLQAVDISNENEGFESLVSEPKVQSISEDLKNHFDQLIEKSDATGLYCLKMSLTQGDNSSKGSSDWVSLMHSFPKGQKGKYGEIVKSLTEKGRCLIEDMTISIKDYISSDDESGVIEIIEDLTDSEIKAIDANLDIEESMEFNKLINKLS